jgi:hypothetical protein
VPKGIQQAVVDHAVGRISIPRPRGISECLIQVNPIDSTCALSWDFPEAQERVEMHDPEKLRELASWYREFAERAGNPMIWEGRLRLAEDLDREAERIERTLAANSVEPLER